MTRYQLRVELIEVVEDERRGMTDRNVIDAVESPLWRRQEPLELELVNIGKNLADLKEERWHG